MQLCEHRRRALAQVCWDRVEIDTVPIHIAELPAVAHRQVIQALEVSLRASKGVAAGKG